MELVTIATYALEIATTVAGFTCTTLILRRDSKYVGNRLMAIATTCVGLYTLAIMGYDVIRTEAAVFTLLPLAFALIFSTPMFIFLAMQVMVHSSQWFDEKKNWVPWLVFLAAFVTFLYTSDVATIVSLDPVVNVQVDLLALLIVVVFVLFFLVHSLVDLYVQGIKQAEGVHRRKMVAFEVGILVEIGSVVVNIASQLVEDANVGGVLDLAFFALLAAGMSIIAAGFLIRVNE
ncbi:MAG: hypothetical protein Kow0069_12940 [Promethearchaeota archaeon]